MAVNLSGVPALDMVRVPASAVLVRAPAAAAPRPSAPAVRRTWRRGRWSGIAIPSILVDRPVRAFPPSSGHDKHAGPVFGTVRNGVNSSDLSGDPAGPGMS